VVLVKLTLVSLYGLINGLMLQINPQTMDKTLSMLSNFTELLLKLLKDLLVSSFQDVLLSSLVVEMLFPLFLMFQVSNVEFSVPLMVLEIFITLLLMMQLKTIMV
jgi:hypothetical protein